MTAYRTAPATSQVCGRTLHPRAIAWHLCGPARYRPDRKSHSLYLLICTAGAGVLCTLWQQLLRLLCCSQLQNADLEGWACVHTRLHVSSCVVYGGNRNRECGMEWDGVGDAVVVDLFKSMFTFHVQACHLLPSSTNCIKLHPRTTSTSTHQLASPSSSSHFQPTPHIPDCRLVSFMDQIISVARVPHNRVSMPTSQRG